MSEEDFIKRSQDGPVTVSVEQVGEQFAKETDLTPLDRVACATAVLIPQRPLIDYATLDGEKSATRAIGR